MSRTVLALMLSISVTVVVLLAWEGEIAQQGLIVMGQLKDHNSTSDGRIETFNARGTINSIATDAFIGSNNSLGTHSADLWILGGNWRFSVVNGNLSDFDADIIMTKYDGTGKHT